MLEALLIVSFGGPEGPTDVMPFLQNVTRGRGISEERLAVVAEHYYQFGGISPINQHNRELITALTDEFASRDVQIPIYWGNRNWHPMLADTVTEMANDGIANAVAYVTSAFGSYSGCRQYAEDIVKAQTAVGAKAPLIHKLPPFWNQEGFLTTMAEHLATAQTTAPDAFVLFTAHSIPESMAATAPYVAQLQSACAQVAERAGTNSWRLVYQSRSGPPQVPWLEPDVCEELERLAETQTKNVILVPIGFVSDHMEVIYDLDIEAHKTAQSLGLRLLRVPTVDTHTRIVKMIADMVLGPIPSPCPTNCCLPPPKPKPKLHAQKR